MKLYNAAVNYVSVLSAFGTILLVALLRFVLKLYHARNTMLKLRRQGLPMPPYSPLFGHLVFCYKVTSAIPKDAHPNYLPDLIRRAMPDLGPVYYLDTWPFGPQMLVVASPTSIHQVTQEHSLAKYHAMKTFLQPITDGLDIVTMEGEQWKTWRGIFNPGFSTSHLMTLIPGIIEETVTFCNSLQSYLEDGRSFKMKNLTDFLALDIIGRVVLNTQLDSQRRSNPLVDGLRMQIRWLAFGLDVNPFKRYNVLRPFVHWYNARRMNHYVSQELDARMADIQTNKQTKSIVDLALTAYLSEDSEGKTAQGMNDTFKKFAISQIKLFLFSGHDTTSSSMCYLFYVLSCNPSVLCRIQAEHDQTLGLDLDDVVSLLSSKPFLLNQLPYTTAVIKEALRLYPAVSSTRAGEPGFSVTDEEGRQFPTEGFLVWVNPQTIQRDPAYWRQPDDFIPERWLVPTDDPLHPVKGTWRPFEYGPRNCIGQELAMIEMKIVMLMTLRRFKVKPIYDELDLHKGQGKTRTIYGERGYQIERAQPSDDLPCRVDKVDR